MKSVKRLFVVVFFLLALTACNARATPIALVRTISPPPSSTPTPVPVTEIIDQVGGTSHALASRDQYVFLGLGARLVVVDVADAQNPVQVGQTGILPSFVSSVTLSGNFAYVACFNIPGLYIFDVTDLTKPVQVNLISFESIPVSIDVQENHVFVGSVSGFSVFDNTNPAALLLEGSYLAPGYVPNVTVSGKNAYVINEKKVLIVDISNPASPVEKGEYEFSDYIGDISASGTYLYAVVNRDMLVIDASDASNPKLASSTKIPGGSNSGVLIMIGVDNGYAYLGGNGIYVVNLGNPAKPVLAGHLEDVGGEAVSAGNGRVYLASYYGGMAILDVTDPTNVKKAGEFRPLGRPDTLALNGNVLYVSDNFGVHIYDVSNPTSMIERGYYGTGDYYRIADIKIQGNYAYLALPQRGMSILDITEPFAPVETGKLPLNTSSMGGFGGEGLAISGTDVYVVAYETLYVIDVSDPAKPAQVARMRLPTNQNGMRKIAISGNYAYAVNGTEGLHIIDISESSSPKLVSTLQTGAEAGNLVIAGGFLYLSEAQNNGMGGGMRIYDISDPLNPREVGYIGSQDAVGIAISGNTAYLADWYAGMQIIDISNPSNPFIADNFAGNGPYPTKVVIGNGHAFIAWNHRGLIVLHSAREAQNVQAVPELPSPTPTPNIAMPTQVQVTQTETLSSTPSATPVPTATATLMPINFTFR